MIETDRGSTRTNGRFDQHRIAVLGIACIEAKACAVTFRRGNCKLCLFQ